MTLANHAGAYRLLAQNPQLTMAILQAMANMGLVRPEVMVLPITPLMLHYHCANSFAFTETNDERTTRAGW